MSKFISRVKVGRVQMEFRFVPKSMLEDGWGMARIMGHPHGRLIGVWRFEFIIYLWRNKLECQGK